MGANYNWTLDELEGQLSKEGKSEYSVQEEDDVLTIYCPYCDATVTATDRKLSELRKHLKSNLHEGNLPIVTTPRPQPRKTWQPNDLGKQLQSEGYGGFTAVHKVGGVLMIYCTFCDHNIRVTDRGLEDFEEHVNTDFHVANVQEDQQKNFGFNIIDATKKLSIEIPPVGQIRKVPVEQELDKISEAAAFPAQNAPRPKPMPQKPQVLKAAPVPAPMRMPSGGPMPGPRCAAAPAQPRKVPPNAFPRPPVPAAAAQAPQQKTNRVDYSWQFYEETIGHWIDMEDGDTIEQVYCQVDTDECFVIIPAAAGARTGPGDNMEMGTLYFRDGQSMLMTFQKSNRKMKVRRQSDLSKWNWYWLDGNQKWNRYDSQKSVAEEDIEEAYLAFAPHLQFDSDDGTSYVITFARMAQRNQESGTEREVRRRPEFGAVSAPKQAKWGWYWLDDNNRWNKYENKVTKDIERAFQTKEDQFSFDVNGQNYVLDFSYEMQINTNSTKQRKILRQMESKMPNAVKNVKKWIWFWLDDNNAWNKYEAKDSDTIEEAYLASNERYRFNTKGQSYDLDFSKMTQKNSNSNKERKIQRVQKGQVPSPAKNVRRWNWFWLDDKNAWNQYRDKDSDQIEEAHTTGNDRHNFRRKNQNYELDFAKMVQRNLNSKKDRRIVRVQVGQQPVAVPKVVRNWNWFWLDDNNAWKQYEDIVADDIEQVHQAGNDRHQFGRQDQNYELLFSRMVQKNLNSNKERRIARVQAGQQPAAIAPAPAPAAVANANLAQGPPAFNQLQGPAQLFQMLNAARQVSKANWYWLNDNNTWQQYGTQETDAIEAAYNANTRGNYQSNLNGKLYEIDFARMIQKNVNTNTERRVTRQVAGMGNDPRRRSARGRRARPRLMNPAAALGRGHPMQPNKNWGLDDDGIFLQPINPYPAPPKKQGSDHTPLPDHWDDLGDTVGVKKVQLTRTGKMYAEYYRVEQKFGATMQGQGTAIKSITRLQSLELYDRYERNKTWLKMKRNGKDPKELDLFHGTSAKNVDAICEQGFDFRISGSSHGAAFGKGTYFAPAASTASGYTPQDRTMFMCKVLVGDSCVGNPNLTRPPAKNGNELFDSCCDNTGNPSMYIIFAREQAYPEYIIRY